jgi:AcrR family transcriptional regulator
MEIIDRNKEIINNCLELLVSKGLTETSTRDLSKAIKLQSGGIYYYFASKDELIIACAEEATLRIENNLVTSAMDEVRNPKEMIERLQSRALDMAPMMKFFVSVCTEKRYAEGIKPVLERLGKRYTQYSNKFAELLKCDSREITPFVYMCITAISNYMIFEEKSFVAPQMKAIRIKLDRILANGSDGSDT